MVKEVVLDGLGGEYYEGIHGTTTHLESQVKHCSSRLKTGTRRKMSSNLMITYLSRRNTKFVVVLPGRYVAFA